MSVKRIIGAIIFMLMMNSLSAQQPVVLFEVGGNYFKTKGSYSAFSTSEQTSINPTVFGKIGFFHTQRGVIGASYLFGKNKGESSSTAVTGNYTHQSYNSEVTRNHTFGLFYRYYLKPYTVSRWNLFVEANPNYAKVRYDRKQLTATTITNGSIQEGISASFTESRLRLDSKWLALDLNTGVSYRIVGGLSAQLTLWSVVNATSEIGTPGNKRNALNIFHAPLKNTLLSLTYTL